MGGGAAVGGWRRGGWWWWAAVVAVGAVVVMPRHAAANIDLYMSSEETHRLLGLLAELYYVREGVINTYALNFTVPVPANFTYIYFTWKSLIKRPMQYMAHIDYNNGEAMALPQLNISNKGVVPIQPDTFSVSLPCSGRVNAEVMVNLHLNITTQNLTNITIKRKKICLKEEFAPRNESIYLRPEWMSTSLGTLYVAMGAACTFTVLVITIASVLYLRVKRTRTQASLTCRYYSGPGYMGDTSGTTGGSVRGPASLRSNSYVTIASFKKVPIISSEKKKKAKVCAAGAGGESLHYASSPLSQVYSQPYSPAHSLPASRHSHASCCASSLHSQASWRDPRNLDPSERVRQLAIDGWKVEVGEVVQEGTFGRVLLGVYRDPYARAALNVIIKTVSSEASSAQARMAVREGLLLAGLHHQHLLPVLGVCLADPRRPLLLYPHLGLTNLKTYLLGCGRGSNEGVKLLTRDLVHIAIQICLGLIHLHQQRLLHKDVATRNCLIDSELQVRVSDTALARDLFPQDYHCLGDNENRSVKWLSLEALIHKQFTPANDVWMFGVLLWELATLAQQPYIEVDPFEMAAYLRDGYRLAQPNNCPDELFGMMARCWAPAPEDRASFPHLLSCLQDFYSALGKYI
ncbi:tyrosine-protein kinase Dnt-like isoform X1 [Portunus trituberculatus]|uniref:tyrosine-protein kinase Dnt-like isoform X1 n=1 Tax=Portunus trituberculatus TaxID=210409 RepID=UPI001E1CCCF4|nr:tyrosine-protein kinase Dnt-like isoform X1 [Portunus trituberculatus]XP_045133810.1 tyrosine-protein kinase Dnt-like isoform X1 [Portunus trituberculatus]XP_045133811.1 tyrosine-protein kinase Dnt-like isoform X1 [Portunus trituberculatus]XP_045133812.1 tyrosine-protein kinase Dnt-like isoform X1 [Portunus trituberculatus]XP_045133813.1 tyrosine-protein kinase Dnt-like isoform X1 [Portunus trituberculatus]XP_045133814.1 tyrosine-protein kinase Dnt-like isoform X1 [Portunus trituberculatus]